MPSYLDTETGQVVEASAEQVAAAYLAGRARVKPGTELPIAGPEGQVGFVPIEQFEEAAGSGWRVASDVEVEKARLQAEYGDQVLAAGAAGLARGATFGLSDLALTETGAIDAETLRGLKEANPGASTAGELAGAVAPMLLTGGGSAAVTGASAASRAAGAAGQVARVAGAIPRGTAALGRAAEAGTAGILGSRAGTLLGKATSMAAGGAVEGAVIGAGQAVSTAALDDAELTAEQLIAGAGHGALLGAAAGGAFGAVTRGVEAAGQQIVKRLPDKARKLFTREGAAEVLEEYADRQAFATARNPTGGQGFVKEAIGKKGGIERGGRIAREDYQIGPTTTVDDIAKQAPVQKAKAGERVGESLRRLDEVASPEALPQAATIAKRVREKVIAPLRKSNSKQLKRMAQRIEDEIGGQGFLGEEGAWTLQDLHAQRRVLDDLAYKENLSGTMGKPTAFGEELIKVRRIVEDEIEQAAERIGKSAGEDILTGYRDAKERYGWHSLFERMSNDAVTRNATNDAIGLMGSNFGNAVNLMDVAAGSGLGIDNLIIPFVAGRLHRLVRDHMPGVALAAANQLRKAQGITKTAETVEKQMDGAIRKFFSQASDAPKRAIPAAAAQSAAAPRQERFDDAVAEVKSVTPQRIVEHAAEVAADHGTMTAAYSAAAARGVEFLRSKLPRPRIDDATLRPDLDKTERVSPADQAQFLAYAKAVKEPMSVVRALERGDVTREQIEALSAVYPKLYQSMVTRIVDMVSRQDSELPYAKLRQLSIALQMPLHATMTPEFIAFAQSRYQQEPGQDDSMQPMLAPSRRQAPNFAGQLATKTQQMEMQG